MTAEKKRRANQRNARKCTGPRTAAGKARSACNALRHGLARSARLDPELIRVIATLARSIAGEDASAERRERADRIAAAHVEVMRARKAKQDLYARGRDWDDLTKRLVKLDRYERRALSRRKFAMRRFDAAPVAEGDVWLEHFGKTKPSVARVKRPQRRIIRCARGRAAWPSGWLRRRVPRWRAFLAERNHASACSGKSPPRTLTRGGNRFSDKDMRQQKESRARPDSNGTGRALVWRFRSPHHYLPRVRDADF